MKAKFVCLLGILLLASPMAVFAGSACVSGASAGPTILQVGKSLDFDFAAPAGGTNYYQVSLVSGHSYSFAAIMDYDDAVSALPIAVTLYKDATCSTSLAAGSATTGYRDTSTMDPAVPLNAFRGSVIASVTGPYTIKVQNNAANGVYLQITVAETTLYSPSFTENSPYHTFYAFANNSSLTISGKLTLTTAGASPQSFSTAINAIPVGGSAGSDTTFNAGLAGKGGSAIFAHDGPANSIQAVSVVTNFNGYVNNVAFVPLRQQ